MITAVDTNVLLDLLGADPTHGPRALQTLRQCSAEGKLVVSDVVWAEISAWFPSGEDCATQMAAMSIAFDPLTVDAAARAGALWKAYRAAGGPRDRVIADFLVGSHALQQADRLLTRDRGFYRERFKGLTVVDPSADAA